MTLQLLDITGNSPRTISSLFHRPQRLIILSLNFHKLRYPQILFQHRKIISYILWRFLVGCIGQDTVVGQMRYSSLDDLTQHQPLLCVTETLSTFQTLEDVQQLQANITGTVGVVGEDGRHCVRVVYINIAQIGYNHYLSLGVGAPDGYLAGLEELLDPIKPLIGIYQLRGVLIKTPFQIGITPDVGFYIDNGDPKGASPATPDASPAAAPWELIGIEDTSHSPGDLRTRWQGVTSLPRDTRPNQEILVPDLLKNSHVTEISSSDWLFTCVGRFPSSNHTP
eukprot:sb/3467870/